MGNENQTEPKTKPRKTGAEENPQLHATPYPLTT
jgi:hypothetical protein